MTHHKPELTILSSADMDELGLDIGQITELLEGAFLSKAGAAVVMPPKVWFYRSGPRFYSAMACASFDLGFAGCKWQSGDPDNPDRGLPYIQGMYILNEDPTGRMLAIMDAEWITGHRTAAASGLVVKHLAKREAKVLGILGCGLQGRKHVEAVLHVRPDIERCVCYDLYPERQARFIEEMEQRHELEISGGSGPEEVARASDVLVTGGPIMDRRRPVIEPAWIKTGALVVTIDYDSYVTDAAIAAMDLVLTDDREQIRDARAKEGKFSGVTRIDASLDEMLSEGKGRRTSEDQRIMVFNLGIALEDLATAVEIYDRAGKLGAGHRVGT